MDVAVARRLEPPRWLNLRTCLGLLLFLISLASGWRVLASADSGYRVWSIASDVPEGAELTPDHLQVVEVDLPAAQLARYLSADVPLDGIRLLRPHRAGELIAASSVTDSGVAGSGRIVTIPITAEHAAGGALRPGDRVDVFASLAAGRPDARTTLLVSAAQVQELVHAGGLVMDEEPLAAVTLQVTPEEAAKVAFAVRSADIDIVRVVGEASSDLPGPVTEDDL